jgi:chromate transporter
VSGSERRTGGRLLPFTLYFLRLGAVGFGGPPALVGYMHRDLVERRGWVEEDEYNLAMALSQIMPGPLAAQLAIALGYFKHGVRGATLVGLAFVLPSFLMVLALAAAYVAFGGLWWMQALFYGIGAAVIAIIAIGSYRLALKTNKRDPLLWGVFAALFISTVWLQAELAQAFIVSGLVVLVIKAPPRWLKSVAPRLSPALLPVGGSLLPSLPTAAERGGDALVDLLLFFTEAGAFVFGSGLAIVPFLNEGVVQRHGWLTEGQFLDAVAVAMITPGPVVITVAFIGYLVAGLGGAAVAAVGIFLPVYVLTILPAPWFRKRRDNAQLRAFAQGATAAATGAIAGAVVVLGGRAIYDAPTALIALGSLGLLWRFKLPEPALVALSGVAGLALWSLGGGAG